MKKCYKLYRYLFFRLYKWNEHVLGREEMPSLNAFLFQSFFLFLHFITFVMLMQVVSRARAFDFFIEYKYLLFLVLVLDLVLNYFVLIYNGKSQKCFAEFERIDPKKRKQYNFVIALYALSILVIFIVSIVLVVKYGRSQ
jgi:hypothetical protein